MIMRFDFAVVQQAGIADGSQLHVVRLLTLYPKAALCYRSMPIPSSSGAQAGERHGQWWLPINKGAGAAAV
jgi:hypothetical protein